jgi:DNA-directed RNA polymerase subunit M/transcription elongation factor TFIIS
MSNAARTQRNLCTDCQNLVGSSRNAPPHAKLVLTGNRKGSAGDTEETHYTCKTCSHEWSYETGLNGMGWIV